MLDLQLFFRFVTLLCLVPATVFAMNRDEEGKQPQSMVACARSHHQFAEQIESISATPKDAKQKITHLLQLPAEVLEHILLLACEDDARPKGLEKDWARLRWVCTTFNTTIMNCPEIWAQTNVRLRTIERTNDFLTLCPFKDLLHVTVDVYDSNLLDASNHATFGALKAAMAKNPSYFTLSVLDPTKGQLETLGNQPSPLHVKFNHTDNALLYLSTHIPNLQHLQLEGCQGVQTLHLNCPQLEMLNITDCNVLSNLSLSNVPHLKVLKVNEADLKTLSLGHLKKLHTLDIDSVENLEVPPLEQLPNPEALKVLRIGTYVTCQDAPHIPFSLLHNLHTLAIQGKFDFPDLTLFPKLEHLELRGRTNAHTPELVHPQLKTLIVGYYDTLPPLSSENLPRLRVLEINTCRDLTHLPLDNIQNLKTLKVINCKRLEDIALAGLNNLQAATFQLNGVLNRLSIDQLPMLQTLKILTCTGLNHLHLGTLPRLQSVIVEAADSLQIVDFNQLPCLELVKFARGRAPTNILLTQLPAFQKLEFQHCDGLTHLALKQLPSFQTLSFWNCKSLSTLSLEEVPSLQTLQLSFCRQLKQLSVDDTPKLEEITLDHCPKIETLAIPGPLTNLHTAKFIDCSNAVGAEIAALRAQAPEYYEPVEMCECDY